MNIGEKIKAIRTGKNLSQKEIALSVGLDRGQYSRIENGKVEPTLSSLEKIAKALNIKVNELFSDDNNYDIDTFDKSLVEKVKLIDQLEENQKKSIYTFIDLAIANKKLRDTLSTALNFSH